MFSMWEKVSGCMGSEGESESERKSERKSESEGEREYAGRQRVPEGEMAAKNRRGRKGKIRAAAHEGEF
jgi:hypothetical protein